MDKKRVLSTKNGSSDSWILPDSEVVEQASGTETAYFTASLIAEGDTVADLTAGLGINTLFFSRVASKVYAVEINALRTETLRRNLINEGIENVKVVNADCVEWLKDCDKRFDVCYADPSRRTKDGKRLVKFQDYSPNILQLIPLLKPRCKRLLVKASPLLDLTDTARQIPEIEGFLIVEHRREVKELILDINLETKEGDVNAGNPYIKCVHLESDRAPRTIEFRLTDEESFPQRYAWGKKNLEANGYIYEPSPSIMKSGKFKALGAQFPDLLKLSGNTHLFYSNKFVAGFPGRVFKIEDHIGSSDLKKLKGGKFNVISRNHPAKAPELEKRYNFQTSSDRYIIATSAGNEKVILLTTKINNDI